MAENKVNYQSVVETDGFRTFVSVNTPNFSKMDNCAIASDICDSGLESMGGLEVSSNTWHSDIEKTVVSNRTTAECFSNSPDLIDEFCKLSVHNDFDDEGVECESIGAMSGDNLDSQTYNNVSRELINENSNDLEVDLCQRDDDGDTILHVAIIGEMKPVALTLISVCTQTSWLNIQNYLLQTALHLAVLTGQNEIVDALIKLGVDVTLRDHQGNTALHLSCKLGNFAAVQTIIKHLVHDVNKRNEIFNMRNCDGLTCVHIAAMNRKFCILKYMFANGADINVSDAKSGRTALHNAVETNDVQLVNFLLSYSKINVDCKTFSGETPLVVAYWRNFRRIIKMLKSRGAFFSYDMVENIFSGLT